MFQHTSPQNAKRPFEVHVRSIKLCQCYSSSSSSSSSRQEEEEKEETILKALLTEIPFNHNYDLLQIRVAFVAARPRLKMVSVSANISMHFA
ncbi:Hypothetical predicted protein [Octopus vulgaris]|uniref:Uncharacterized protein n=1 Tax=Octopus vulgaris TaxID=6645 RepID=A0AA36F0B6_OCTVU|nr:Hypothetical predicted protein [Octopus vulgaris]